MALHEYERRRRDEMVDVERTDVSGADREHVAERPHE
jgi:hypothetical protein